MLLRISLVQNELPEATLDLYWKGVYPISCRAFESKPKRKRALSYPRTGTGLRRHSVGFFSRSSNHMWTRCDTYIHTYMHACMHACIHTYLSDTYHRYIDASMHRHTCAYRMRTRARATARGERRRRRRLEDVERAARRVGSSTATSTTTSAAAPAQREVSRWGWIRVALMDFADLGVDLVDFGADLG